jgi:hypothetical protein
MDRLPQAFETHASMEPLSFILLFSSYLPSTGLDLEEEPIKRWEQDHTMREGQGDICNKGGNHHIKTEDSRWNVMVDCWCE